jgi:hypothetical protein
MATVPGAAPNKYNPYFLPGTALSPRHPDIDPLRAHTTERFLDQRGIAPGVGGCSLWSLLGLSSAAISSSLLLSGRVSLRNAFRVARSACLYVSPRISLRAGTSGMLSGWFCAFTHFASDGAGQVAGYPIMGAGSKPRPNIGSGYLSGLLSRRSRGGSSAAPSGSQSAFY